MMYTKKKGMTLIELMIAVAILSIALSVISSFFLTNYKTLNTINRDLELQSQGEKAINFMMDNIIEGYGIVEVVDIDDNKDKKAESKEISIKKLSIIRLEAGGEKYNFELDGNTLNFYKGTDKREICNDVSTIILTPLPSGKSFTDCKGIRIKIKLQIGKSEKEFVNEVYLRNKP